MSDSLKLTLPKVERLNSRILIERLFTGGSKSLPAFPLRIVYMPVEGENLPVATILISVPKKRFKRAVKRNRVKRQVREAYRKNKHILLDALKDSGRKIAIAFIWLDNELHESADVEAKVVKLLQLTAARLVCKSSFLSCSCSPFIFTGTAFHPLRLPPVALLRLALNMP